MDGSAKWIVNVRQVGPLLWQWTTERWIAPPSGTGGERPPLARMVIDIGGTFTERGAERAARRAIVRHERYERSRRSFEFQA